MGSLKKRPRLDAEDSQGTATEVNVLAVRPPDVGAGLHGRALALLQQQEESETHLAVRALHLHALETLGHAGHPSRGRRAWSHLSPTPMSTWCDYIWSTGGN